MTTFVAPAGEPWTAAHLFDPARDAALPLAGEGHARGWTVCGRELVPAELWLHVPTDVAEPICPGCCGDEVQEAMFG